MCLRFCFKDEMREESNEDAEEDEQEEGLDNFDAEAKGEKKTTCSNLSKFHVVRT